MFYYSKSKRGFFNVEIHGENIPKDCVEVTPDHWNYLLDGQSTGKNIEPDENGFPILVERPIPTINPMVSA